MAIQSINTLQNADNYNNIAKEYLLESLANLGQRYNVKGDSISIDSLYLNRLFSFTNENLDDLCVVVSKENDEYRIYLVKKQDISTVFLPEQTISTKNDIVVLDDFYLKTNKNTQYCSVKFKSDALYYTILGREDVNTSLDKTNFFLERYDRNTNLLTDGIRIFKKHFSDSITFLQDKYLLVYIKLNDNLTYTVKSYRSNLDIESLSDNEIYSFLEGIDLDNVRLDGLFTAISTDTCDYNNYRIIPSSSTLSWIGNSNDQDIFENNILYSFTNDIKNLYPVAKEKYSVTEYGSLDSIYVKLLINLYDSIKLHDAATNKIYIPLIDKDGNPYSISYTYNINKEEEVYFSGKEIEVRYIVDEIDSDWMTLNMDDYRGSIITYSANAEKVSFYFFESKLDNENVIDIKVKKISTLPYIDDNGYWVINDISTGIYAKGVNAGNPNIIIAETSNRGESYTIIAGAKREELLKQLTWEKRVAKVEPLEKINLDNLSFKGEYDYFSVNCCIPTLSKIPQINKKSWMSQLENAIIICVSPVSCIDYDNNNSKDNINYTEQDVYRIYGEYGIITTLWTITEEGEFDYIRKSDNQYAAADFNYLSNINNLIQYAVKNAEPLHPDNFEFTRIVFDPTSTTLKNNSVEYKTNLYGNISNKLSAEYNLSNYNNDLNLTIKYNDVILKSNDKRNIEALTQSGDLRYFNTTYNNGDSNSTNIVTNSLYNYYENGIYKRYNEYVPNYNVPTIDYSEVLTRNQTLLNRLNILSFDNTGTSYLSYIGTSIDYSKNILTIGTTNTNINMGTDTLITQSERSSFVKQHQVNVDFDTIKLNGNTYVGTDLTVGNNITLDGVVWSKDYLNVKNSSETIDTTYYTTLYTPASRYLYELNDKYSNRYSIGVVNIFPEDVIYLFENDLITDSDNNYAYSNVMLKTLLSKSLYNYAMSKNKMFIITTLAEYYKHENWDPNTATFTRSQSSHMIYYSDGIYLPVLLNHLGLDSYITEKGTNISTSNVILTSNMEIISVNSNPLIALSSSTNLYPDKYLYDAKGEQISNFTYTIFTANSLKATYYTVGNKLYLHLEELYGKNKFVPNKEIRHNYNIS